MISQTIESRQRPRHVSREKILLMGCRKSHNLWKVKRVIADSVEDKILKLVDYP